MPDDFYECLKDFQFSLPLALNALSPSISKAETVIASPPKRVVKELFALNHTVLSKPDFYEFLKISCEFRYDRTAILEQNPEQHVSDEHITAFAACELSSTLEDALLLAQLAYPTRIKSESGRSYVGAQAMNHITAIQGFPYDIMFDNDTAWPRLTVLSLEDVVSWETKLGLFQRGIANSPVQRTLAAFTHAAALSASQGGEILFWTMQGLEAFYCRSSGDLRKQLSERSRVFLGPWEDKKNIVGHLYDIRSKFVHGDFNIERWNNNLECDPSDWKGLVAFDAAMTLGVRMLVATLQKCAKEQIVSAEFVYSLRINDKH